MGEIIDTLTWRSSFAGYVRHWAATQPDAPAVTVGAPDDAPDDTLTYGELDALSSRVANALGSLGVGPGGRVGHLGRNRIGYPALLYGASKQRATMVGLNWRFTARELTPLLADSAPAVIVVDDEFRATAEEAVAGSGIATTLLSGDDVAAWAADDDTDPGTESQPDDVALIFYTSGTTGVPKGAMLTAGSIANHLTRPTPWTMTPSSTVLVASPMFHTAGTGWLYLPGSCGSHCVVLRDPAPAQILERLSRHRVTHTLLVPTVIRMILDAADPASFDLSALQTMAYGASPIPPALLARAIEAFGCEFVQAYGMTETGGPICYLWPADHDPSVPGRLRSAGRPLDGVEVRITDPETGEPCPVGEFGEVWTRSDQQMIGYLNRPEATAATVTPEGWLRTGDGGYADADGYVYLTDRLSDVIVTGAENVYPLEVENVLAAHADVAEVSVIGVADERWGETVIAVVVPRPGVAADDDTAAALIAHAREHLAHYKAPTRVEFVAELPKNPAGKVLRRLLRQERAPKT